jgi:glutamate formiminotransferase/formiminotetrahydrofolate cyclodeaminase
MIHDKTQPIDAFLNATAAKSPTPGGGSVAALAGALAAAMGEMVLNYSVGKKDLAPYQDELKHGLDELHRARQILLELMIEDQAAYAALTEVRKLPPDDPQRSSKHDAAVLVCIRIPQSIGITAAAVLGICDRLAEKVNRYLLSDLAVCAELSMATIRSAAYSVRVNLPEVTDVTERSRFQQTVEKQVADSTKIIQRLIPQIWARVEQN